MWERRRERADSCDRWCSTLSAVPLRSWRDYANIYLPFHRTPGYGRCGRWNIHYIHAYRGKCVDNWKTDGANFCFSYSSAELQFHLTGKGSGEGARATSLITHVPHCTPTDLTPLKQPPKNQYSCECTPTHTLKDRSQRTSTCELMNIWMQHKYESEGAAESSHSNGVRDWVRPGGIHGAHWCSSKRSQWLQLWTPRLATCMHVYVVALWWSSTGFCRNVPLPRTTTGILKVQVLTRAQGFKADNYHEAELRHSLLGIA